MPVVQIVRYHGPSHRALLAQPKLLHLVGDKSTLLTAATPAAAALPAALSVGPPSRLEANHGAESGPIVLRYPPHGLMADQRAVKRSLAECTIFSGLLRLINVSTEVQFSEMLL